MMKLLDGIVQFLCNFWNWIQFRRYKVKVGKNLIIHGMIFLRGKRITFGNNVRVNSSLSSNPIGGDSRVILSTTPGGKIQIGNNVGMSNCALISKVSINVGNDVMIGGGVKIYDTDFHSLEFAQRMERPDQHASAKAVIIGCGAFIGAHSIILKGVTIGDGAGSVITKSIPDGEVWAGNPARKIVSVSERASD